MFRFKNFSWIILLGLVLLVVPACTDSDLDDPDTGNVVLEVLNVDNPAITGEQDTGYCNDNPEQECLSNDNCPINDFCVLPVNPGECEISEWTVRLANVPKTDLATTTPYNDIFVEAVDILYTWADGETSERTALIGTTIPAGGTASVQFWPMTQDVIRMDATTVSLGLIFRAEVLDGTDIEAVSGADLLIENCQD